MQVVVSVNGNPVALGGEVAQRAFGSGSIGYQSAGKVVLDGKTYQAQVQFVEVGSKTRQDAAAIALRAENAAG